MAKNKSNIIDDSLTACRIVFLYTFLFSFAANLMMLALPLYTLQVLDRVISSHSLETLVMLTIIVIAALFAMGFIQTIRSFILLKVGDWLDNKLSPLLLKNSLASAVAPSENFGSQSLRDLNTLKGFLTGPAIIALFDAPWSILFIIVLFLIHPVHGFVALLGGIILFLLAYLNERMTRDSVLRANENFLKSMNQVDVSTRNAEVIEAMGMANNIVKNWLDFNAKGLKFQMLSGVKSALINGVSRVVRLILQVAIVGAGGYLVLLDELTVGAMIAGLILISRALAPFEMAIGSWKGVISARQSYYKLKKSIMDAPKRNSSIKLPKPKGRLDVEKLFFVPGGSQKPILNNVSFKLQPGEILAVIGPSAAGKSTLAKIITGVWPASAGKVRLDGADVYGWDREDFSKYIGYVPQDVELFNGSVAMNIARMDENGDEDAIVDAAKITSTHDMILHFANGYETEIGVGGASLSAGQRQRIALARAFYNKPKLLILDEPNANLDTEGDIALAAALSYCKINQITTIVISHKGTVLAQVDKILTLKDGQVASFGAKDEIIKAVKTNFKPTIKSSGK